MDRFQRLFEVKKPIIGMIHLAGEDFPERLERAREELTIYNDVGLDGAIIENYHGSSSDLIRVLSETHGMNLRLVRGLNFLGNYKAAFNSAGENNIGFIQIDSVQGNHLNLEDYNKLRQRFPEVIVLGGVGFKYTSPSNLPLEEELEQCKKRCDAIVTTGSGTGKETPIKKLVEYKRLLGGFPLIAGAGVNLHNIREQLQICDGAIVGSYFKGGNTSLRVDAQRGRDLMKIVYELRKD